MLRRNESLEEFQERLDREHAKFLRKLRRERWSMFALLFAWAIYMCILPFIDSPDLILLMLGIFAIFFGQFIFVMGMD